MILKKKSGYQIRLNFESTFIDMFQKKKYFLINLYKGFRRASRERQPVTEKQLEEDISVILSETDTEIYFRLNQKNNLLDKFNFKNSWKCGQRGDHKC